MTLRQCPGRDLNSHAASAAGDFEFPAAPGSEKCTECRDGASEREMASLPLSSATTSATTRWCSRCSRDRELSAFGLRTKRGKRVPQPYCRDCMVGYHKEWRATAVGNEKFTTAIARHRKQYPERKRARDAAFAAIRRGALTKGPCELADSDCRGGIQAHHDDYSKPLEVRWTCRRHHSVLDRQRRVSRPAQTGERV